jgi:hypothetical protein
LSCIINPKNSNPKLQKVDEMLAWCYFQYLESNHFLGVDKTYLYGELLQQSQGFEETFLVILEMLRLYFPAG